MRVIRIVMREVDQSTLIVPDVLTVHDHAVSGGKRHALADVDVVLDEEGLRRSFDLHDEALMRARWACVIREEPRDVALRGDLYLRAMFRKGALDGCVARDDSTAGEGKYRDEDERTSYCERGTLFAAATDPQRWRRLRD
jgi:hypothetical protein